MSILEKLKNSLLKRASGVKGHFGSGEKGHFQSDLKGPIVKNLSGLSARFFCFADMLGRPDGDDIFPGQERRNTWTQFVAKAEQIVSGTCQDQEIAVPKLIMGQQPLKCAFERPIS